MVFDYAVIGGGVVGTAIFNKLTLTGNKCVLLEKQSDVGFGASKANSGIVHTGFDCKPNTLKAKLNVRGAELLPQIAKRVGVLYKRNGHLVVGNDLEKLTELLNRGVANGVKDLQIVQGETLFKLEPNLNPNIKYALYAKNGGIISSYELSVALAEEAIINGGVAKLLFDLKSAKQKNSVFNLISTSGEQVQAKCVINACGAGYNDVAKILKTEVYDVKFRLGEYYLLDKSCANVTTHTVFPLPTKNSKGILITPSTYGNILVGPTAQDVSDNLPITTAQGLSYIKSQAQNSINNLPLQKTIRVFSGVRTFVGDDFIITKSQKNANVVNVAGICSPGLTSAPAIAEYVLQILGLNTTNLPNLKLRKVPICMSSLSLQQQEQIIAKNPEFGLVVCKCENVSLGEIKQAVNSVLPATTVDAVKRRTRAGMGKCQSGFCIFKVMDQIAKANNISFDEVQKDGYGSTIIKSQIKQGVTN